MGVGLGWKEAAPQFPYIDGELWNDGVTRSGNTVNFSFNFRLRVRTKGGYWNYAWYLNMKCGNNQVTDKKVKNQSSRNENIAGQDFWYSTFNGTFTGSVQVSGQAQSIPVEVTFHDSKGNWGATQTWNVPIPTASSMSAVRTSVSNITDESASLLGRIDFNGSYSTITGWRLEYGQNSITENNIFKNTTGLSQSWSLSNLSSATYYQYRITVYNSAGFSQSATGSFFTDDSVIGDLIIDGRPTKLLTGYIIRPDGKTQKIKEVRKVT